tara:strand:- start:26432 stop:26869 length:438 start_codon:yes stop_codon:yes gene_type:complete
MITWKKDPFQSEYSAFKSAAEKYGINPKDAGQKLINIKLEYNKSNKTFLTNSIWKNMKETTSWGVSSLYDIFDNLKRSGKKKNVSRLLQQYTGGGDINDWMGSVSCPIVCRHENGNHALIAGNIRLSVAKMLKIKPQVIIVDTDW